MRWPERSGWLERPPAAWIVPLLICACLIAGCGGSGGSTAERSRLAHKLAAQAGSLPPDLSSCVAQRARSLPIAQLRQLAQGSGLGPTLKPVAVRLVTSCIQQGKGVPALRSVIARGVAASMPSTLPAAFRACVEHKAAALSAGQISQFLSTYANSGESGVRSEGEQVGHRLAIQCLSEPGAEASLRALFLKPLQQLAHSNRYPKAFRECVLRKAEQITPAQLKQFVLHPEQAAVIGRALGEHYARECGAPKAA